MPCCPWCYRRGWQDRARSTALAADEFIGAAEMFDEAGRAEGGGGGGWKMEGESWQFVRSFNFHAPSMKGQVGHWLSKVKINSFGHSLVPARWQRQLEAVRSEFDPADDPCRVPAVAGNVASSNLGQPAEGKGATPEPWTPAQRWATPARPCTGLERNWR